MNEDNERNYYEALADLENAQSLIDDLRHVLSGNCDRNALVMAQSHVQQAVFFLKEARK